MFFLARFFAAWMPLIGLLLLASPVCALEYGDGPHFVWRVPGEQNVVYLVGSIHSLPPEAHPLPEVYERAYASSQTIMFETDIEALQAPETYQWFNKFSRLPSGKSLKSELPPELYNSLDTFVSKFAFSSRIKKDINKYKPWRAAMIIQELVSRVRDSEFEHGVDAYYWRRADEDRKRIKIFDPVKIHYAWFALMSEQESETHLAETIASATKVTEETHVMAWLLSDSEMESVAQKMAKLNESGSNDDSLAVEQSLSTTTEIWMSGDVEAMAKHTIEPIAERSAYQKHMLDKVNARWLPYIKTLLHDSENAMVVVGAGHMLGENSLVDLLTRLGYEPVLAGQYENAKSMQ